MAEIDPNAVINILHIGVIIWVGKRHVGRLDAIESTLTSIRERLARLEATSSKRV